MNNRQPNILIASPQSDVKNYCFEDWLNNVKSFEYENYDIFLADNSQTEENSKTLQEKYKVKSKWTTSTENEKSLMKKLTDSHNACREEVLKGGYEFLLHLETDIFPPSEVINELLFSKKRCVGALYDIGFADNRQLMYRTIEKDEERLAIVLDGEDREKWLDGGVHKILGCGLGCNLIHKSILQKIKFRMEENSNIFPSLLFGLDLDKLNIPQYLHTGVFCEHRNEDWGVYGQDYN